MRGAMRAMALWAVELVVIPLLASAAQLRMQAGEAPAPAPPSALPAAVNGSAVHIDPLGDCFEVPESICLQGAEGSGQQFVIAPKSALSDLILWYDFDKSLPVDDSGHRHHLLDESLNLAPVPAGPGLLGRGGSAAFDGRAFGMVKSTEDLETPAFSVSLWLYLLEDSVGSWRTIFHKGSGPDQLTPALLLWPDERRLHVRVSTRADWNEGVLESVGAVPLRRWTHLAVTSTGSVLRLYINGVKDGEVILEGAPVVSAGDLHIGRDPWRAGTRSFMDDFRWYNRELSAGEVKAISFPSLTGVSADFVSLGCTSCTFPDAVKSCGNEAHLCSLQELFAGGFHNARVLGWLNGASEVWYHNEKQADPFSGARRLGLCCSGD